MRNVDNNKFSQNSEENQPSLLKLGSAWTQQNRKHKSKQLFGKQQ